MPFIRRNVTKQLFAKKYANVFKGDANWRKITVSGGLTYAWDRAVDLRAESTLLRGACSRVRRRSRTSWRRVLGLFLDSITTDHISPAGSSS